MTDEANVHIFAMVDQLIEGKIGICSSFDKKGSRSERYYQSAVNVKTRALH